MKSPMFFSPRSDGVRRLRCAAFVCGLFFINTGRAADAPRTVTTHFILPAKARLLEDYTVQERERCRTEVATKLAELGRRWFNYLTWKPATGNPASATPADLQLTLTETQKAFGDEIGLVFTALIDGVPTPLKYTLPVLYTQSELEKPTGNPNRLIGDVIVRIEAEFISDAFRNNELQPKFLSQVPVAVSFNLDPTAQCVLLPLPGNVLRAGDASQLRIQYSTPPRADSAFLFLHPAVIEKWEQPTRCFVYRFQWIPERADGWTAALLDSYNQRDHATVRVFVAHYAPDYRLPTQDPNGRASQPD